MYCRLLHWSCHGEARLFREPKLLEETCFKRDIRIHVGEDEAGSYPEPGLSNMATRIYALNSVSLVCGLVGNAFLLFNFTQIVRYIIALPVTIILWFIATGIVSNASNSLISVRLRSNACL